MTKEILSEITYEVNGAIIEVHKAMGPGLLESVYQKCLEHELQLRKIDFVKEFYFPTKYKELDLTLEFRGDFLIENTLILETKAVQEIIPFHKAKLLNQMNLAKIPKGLLVNFNVVNITREGLFVMVNKYFNDLPKT